MRNLLFIISIAIACSLGASHLYGNDQVEVDANTMSYGLDTRFFYVDTTEKSDTSVLSPNPAMVRTLGLGLMALDVHWTTSRQTRFRITVRPDANLRRHDGQSNQEFDGRAGGVYAPYPEIELVDQYALEYFADESLLFGFGVLDSFHESTTNRPEIVEFGLKAVLPTKFSSLYFQWNRPMQVAVKGRGFVVDAFLIQGDRDRSEALAENEESYDRAPSSEDPYIGGALRVGIDHPGKMQTYLLLGTFDQKSVHAKKSQMFGQVFFDLPIGAAWLVSGDFRYIRDRWSQGSVETLAQQSYRISLTQLLGRYSVIYDLDLGQSERWVDALNPNDKFPITGGQAGLSFKAVPTQNLSVRLKVAREIREATIDGDKIGGFTNTSGANRELNRVGLEVAYAIQ